MTRKKSTDNNIIHIRSGQKMGAEQAELYDFAESVAEKSKDKKVKSKLHRRLSILGTNADGEPVVIAPDGTETPLED